MGGRFSEIVVERPTEESLARDYAALHDDLDKGRRRKVLKNWDRTRRDFSTWSEVTYLRFAKDTTDPAAKAEQAYASKLGPVQTEHNVALKRRLLEDRSGLEPIVGSHAVKLWEVGLTTFNSAIKPEMEAEEDLYGRYTELIAAGKVTIRGQTVSLAGAGPFVESLDRETRHEAEQARWRFYGRHGKELDQIFDDQVKVRHTMANKLGHDTYTPLAYQLMNRIGYGEAEVGRYRDQIAEDVVPVVARGFEARRAQAGWDRLRYWDEPLTDLKGNPKPAGGYDVLIAGMRTMFANMDPRLAAFYDDMIAGGFIDYKPREGKAGSTFSTMLPSVGMPFVFGTLNGTSRDIVDPPHEFAHGFAGRRNAGKIMDYIIPTMEAGEIHSKAMEYLCHPHVAPLVEEGGAERYRRVHLTRVLASLPFGAAVDHFQHEVYANPAASPADRHDMWKAQERRYMPWRDYGDLERPAQGAAWQALRHIYGSPFYGIDYALAECPALQLWSKSRQDYRGTMNAYIALCERGGEAPFVDLVKGAGLRSPFEPGALKAVVKEVAEYLDLDARDTPSASLRPPRRHGHAGPRILP